MSLSWDGYLSDRDRPFQGDPDEFDEDPANVAVAAEPTQNTETTNNECPF